MGWGLVRWARWGGGGGGSGVGTEMTDLISVKSSVVSDDF